MHSLLINGLDKVLCRMHKSLIFATGKLYKYKESIKFHAKSYKWKESNKVPNSVPCYSVLHRITLIDHTHFSQFMEWQNLGIKTLKHAIYAPNVFLNLLENHLPDFLKFCDNISNKLLRPSQFLKKNI